MQTLRPTGRRCRRAAGCVARRRQGCRIRRLVATQSGRIPRGMPNASSNSGDQSSVSGSNSDVRDALAGSATNGCSAEQCERQVARHRARGEAPVACGGLHLRQVIEAPAQLAGAVMRRQHQPRRTADPSARVPRACVSHAAPRRSCQEIAGLTRGRCAGPSTRSSTAASRVRRPRSNDLAPVRPRTRPAPRRRAPGRVRPRRVRRGRRQTRGADRAVRRRELPAGGVEQQRPAGAAAEVEREIQRRTTRPPATTVAESN